MVIYFYKANDPYGCFSNFSHHPIELAGYRWATVEHYYQAQKFVNTKDEDAIALIRQAPTAKVAAALGRDPARQIREDWERVKRQIMYVAVKTKFLTHLDIQKVLLETGEESLIEDSPTDYYWGCGLDKTGENQLGRILMDVRREIRLNLAT